MTPTASWKVRTCFPETLAVTLDGLEADLGHARYGSWTALKVVSLGQDGDRHRLLVAMRAEWLPAENSDHESRTA